MDRFMWVTTISLIKGEFEVIQKHNVRIYDGDNRTNFDCGTLRLTSHQLIWDDQLQDRTISLGLNLVQKTEEVIAGFNRSAKIILYLQPKPASQEPGPKISSQFNYIRLSFRAGGQSEYYAALCNQLSRKRWITQVTNQRQATRPSGRHMGIVGIERKIEQKQKETQSTISQAFSDLNALMDKAKEMVAIADRVAKKIEEKKGQLSDDETVQFKSYLLSMGINDPVTREEHGYGNKYHEELAKQLATFLKSLIEKSDGLMTLTDVYCMYNRARGIELVSPEDVFIACKLFESLKLPLRLREFDSGVLAVQSESHSVEVIVEKITKIIKSKGCITAEELSPLVKTSITVAKEGLSAAENLGMVCRDDSVEGLRFYLNRFMKDP
ncbi:Vacuolar protein-sorting-associated protein 36 [Trichoplax sp. H2]|nr:Vacuolar protein-sorting-associated protein 36 [Trichoplax sp. H2]|eukprot:RDD39386.1 Vacuolar protein-sorting-associated protein 36 [Trichoplax sp. H2]